MKILVVDYEKKARDKIKKKLTQNSEWEVSLATSEQDAIEKLNAASFDLVVTEMKMETDRSGIAVLEAAKKKDRTVEVIVVTAYASFDGADEAMEKGAYGYISKQDKVPYRKLYKKTEKALEHRKKSHYDVLLVYNHKDQQLVIDIAIKLKDRGLIPWFDLWELSPGDSLLNELKRNIHSIDAMVCFVGKHGMGEGQKRELEMFADKMRTAGNDVIPVFLVNYPKTQQIPDIHPVLKGRIWVDFRKRIPDPFEYLIKGIKKIQSFPEELIKQGERFSPVGISNFERMIQKKYYYIDKSLFVKEIVESGEIILITRPRRFGKTLNMDMLRCFFEKKETSRKHLFENLEIGRFQEYMKIQGEFPVIWLSFKDISESEDWKSCLEDLKLCITEEYNRHKSILGFLDDYHRKRFIAILNGAGNERDFAHSLHFLSCCLHDVYGKRVVVLIDEYDIPIQTAQKNGYYKKAVSFFRTMLTKALKDSKYIEKGVLTGVLRIAKEGIFSGLNNLDVFSMLDETFADKFGFTDSEVSEALHYFDLDHEKETVKKWYDGYDMAGTSVYNPWSIINFLKKRKIKLYWINTSANALLYDLVRGTDAVIKQRWERLFSDMEIKGVIDENLLFSTLHEQTDALWTVLFFSGYLTVADTLDPIGAEFLLRFPNLEVKECFRSSIQRWIKKKVGEQRLNTLSDAIISGDAQRFHESLQDLVETVLSYHDTAGDEPENVYHVFVLGMLIQLEKQYLIRSNRESGRGRYDIMLIPREPGGLGIIIEFKKPGKNETPEEAIKKAFLQIKEKKYIAELNDRNAKEKIAFAVVASGKKVWVDKMTLGRG